MEYKKSLDIIKGFLIVIGGGFWIGYLWIYRPTIGESTTIVVFTLGLLFATEIRNWFYSLIFVLISGFALGLYGYMYLDSFKQLLVMLLVSLPMVSAMLLHMAEQEADNEVL
ncbi:hypothetical protein MOJ76_15605 [Bacillus haynesii]|uniref:hypothetical protein n=1 Tax=Bacillus haynesii TaxID=1925021 RepID=UPI0022813685|nr:hypothetical protein [Bacillus haynesii]MCY8009719.1 hypothetical protein [Bacillus haynesii]